MAHSDTAMRAAGGWLAIGSVLWVGAFALHPPPSPDMGEFMAIIADSGVIWVAVHWVVAVALSLFVVASLIVLGAGSRLTRDWWTMSAWAVFPVGALWILTAAVAEATVISHAAIADDMGTFGAWQLFAEGKAMGFVSLALAVAVIAGNEARISEAAIPAWASWIAVGAAVTALAGWGSGVVLGIGLGGLVWVVSSLVIGLWTIWFGVALMRAGRELSGHIARNPEAAPPS